MPGRADEDEPDDDADLDDHEAPNVMDVDDDAADGDEDTVPCPFCQRPIWEKADLCPHCRSFVAPGDLPAKRPLWFWIALALALLIAALWALRP